MTHRVAIQKQEQESKKKTTHEHELSFLFVPDDGHACIC